MSTSWDKPPNPTTVIRPLSIFTPFFLWTSHLCCKDVFFSAAALCIESLFYSMCGCCGHFEAGSWHHLRICIYHYIVRWIFSFHTKVHSCFLIIWPFLMSVKQRGKKERGGEGAAWKEGGNLPGARVIFWTMTCAWHNYTYGTKIEHVPHMVLCHVMRHKKQGCAGSWYKCWVIRNLVCVMSLSKTVNSRYFRANPTWLSDTDATNVDAHWWGKEWVKYIWNFERMARIKMQ